jgi:hypothetical protein
VLAAVGLLAARAGAQGGRRDTTAARADTGAARRDTTQPPAQPRPAVPLPSDTIGRDTTKVPKDTIKAPLARAPLPPLLGIGARYHWNRDSLFATGALTLLDLLQRLPGVTAFRSGWLASPQYVAYLGNPARVRVFYDGLEIDPLDPRSAGVLDLAEVQLWSLEELAIERGADELRIYMRSWRVDRTSTNTRVDVLTGDQGTNLYRGFYGKRYGNGMAFQLAGQQYGTDTDPTIGGGDELAVIGRLGWAKGPWSVDAFASRASRTRDQQNVQLQGAAGGVAPQERTRIDAYLRAAYGNPDTGPWVQLMAARERFDEHTPFRGTGLPFAPADTADTVRSATQYVASVGLTRGGLRVSATDRLHVLPERTLNSLSARFAYERPWVALSLFADYRGSDTTSTEEAAVRLTPFGVLSLAGAITRRHGGGIGGGGRYATRGELGLLLGRLALSGGVLRRDATVVPGLTAYDSAYTAADAGAATGLFGAARGKFYRDLGVDAFVVRWSAPGYYRPQLQSREEIYLDTRWLSRFPSGNFGFFGAVGHEYRQTVIFPATGGSESLAGATAIALFSHTLVTRLEIRIQDAVIFWQSVYGLNPPVFEYVPGFLQPRQRFVYGVRWQFWN